MVESWLKPYTSVFVFAELELELLVQASAILAEVASASANSVAVNPVGALIVLITDSPVSHTPACFFMLLAV
jgi:hypothetical protein